MPLLSTFLLKVNQPFVLKIMYKNNKLWRIIISALFIYRNSDHGN